MAKPYVSVIIDTYNHERFIEQAILSVLEQDVDARDMEIIVVDDGSTDNTPEVVRKFVPRVRYIRKTNGGQASAFNVGIPQARGEIVAFLDGDDWWARDKLRTVLEVFEKEPEVGAVGHGITEVYAEGQQRHIVPVHPFRVHLGDLEGALAFRLLKAFLGTSRFTARKPVLDRILPVPEELVFEADEFLFTMAAALAEVMVLDRALTYYRLHGDNLYQMQSPDEAKLRRKHRVLAALVQALPPRLAACGVPQEAIDAIVKPIHIQAEQLRLSLDGGRPWETFRVERDAARLAYKDMDLGYRLFKSLVLGLTLLMPPRRFYRLKQWYAARGLRRLREQVGRVTPAAPIIEK